MSKKNAIHFADAIRIDKVPDAFSIMAKPIGSKCNLNCTYCYYLEKENLYSGNKHWAMSEEVLESYIKQYIESQDAPVVNFAWQGGEPTLMGLDFYRRAVELQQRYADGFAGGCFDHDFLHRDR